MPKSTARLRGYLDLENQKLNPTLKAFTKRSHSVSTAQPRDSGEQNPATTKKFVAYVDKRRKEMEDKKHDEEVKFQEEVERCIK